MTPMKDNGVPGRPPTIGTMLARTQPEGKIDPVGTARTATLIDLLGSLADLVTQRVERITQSPAATCTANRALLELVAARALLAESIALLDELADDWKHDRDVPISSEMWN
jgi:hypothetical protein